ncbi:diphthine synthase [Candidatus Bathyarchaeota archaeon]|nr:diphthine synthase [Candidatus Bathyarchaeota archaeon]
MGELIFIGLGLGDERGITLRGLEEAKNADMVFAEFYTNYVPNSYIERLEALIGKRLQILGRIDLEDMVDERLLKPALSGRVALLVPGDPMIATTHMAIRLRASRLGIPTKVIHGVSIVTAVIAASGLQNYRFGQSVSMALEAGDWGEPSRTTYDVCAENLRRGLHTLIFLDFDAERGRYLSIKEAIERMIIMEERWREEVFVPRRLLVGAARVGSEDAIIRAHYLEEMAKLDFGEPPHVLILTGRLHFMEVEALLCLAKAPKDIGPLRFEGP